MEPWQRGGRSKFSGIQEQKQSGIKLQSWQREPGKFSAENAWHTLKKDVVEEKFKVCLADWQKANKHDDTSSKDTFTLVIGNEVNLSNKVYADNVYHIGAEGQVGHSFFYVTKNSKVYSAFSFGPANHNSKIEVNEGTVDYEIGQTFRFHRFKITREQAIQIKKQVDAFRGKVSAPSTITKKQAAPFVGITEVEVNNPNKMYYDPPFGNYTCAAMARDTLTKAGIVIPRGKGAIDLPGNLVKYATQAVTSDPVTGRQVNGITTPIAVVNPYEWYHNIVQKYGEGELYQGRKIKSDNFSFEKPMDILEGESDPLVNTGQDKKVLYLR